MALCDAPPEVVEKQLDTKCGAHAGVQVSAWGDEGPQDKEVREFARWQESCL